MAETAICSKCGGVGYRGSPPVTCQECAGKGYVFTGEHHEGELVDCKYGLTSSGKWVLVKELERYPEECFLTIDELSVGEDRGPGEIITARDVYLNLEPEV